MKTNKVRFAVLTTGPDGAKIRFVREKGTAKDRPVFRPADANRINQLLANFKNEDIYTWISDSGARQGTELYNG